LRDAKPTAAPRSLPAQLWAAAEARPALTIALGVALAAGALLLNDRVGSSRPVHEDTTPVADAAPEPSPLDVLAPIGIERSEVPTLAAALARLPPSTPVWIAYPAVSPRAGAAATALRVLFEQGGADVRGTAPLDYSVRPGVFVFAADETYPSYVDDVAHALAAAVPDVSVMSGYRSYGAEQRATNPSWQGLRMDQGETYVIVVGRVP
jgi:hypothetical protein